jgi:predicted PurR-regulated permease PerM
MQENQNAYQNAGQNGFFYNQSIGNQSSSVFVLILVFILLVALLKSEERYRNLVERLYSKVNDR